MKHSMISPKGKAGAGRSVEGVVLIHGLGRCGAPGGGAGRFAMLPLSRLVAALTAAYLGDGRFPADSERAA